MKNNKIIKEDILKKIHEQILKISSMERAESNKWFFKTGKGEYGEGDKFIGLTVPITRKLAKGFIDKVSLKDIEKLLRSQFHEERLLALLMLVNRFEKRDIVKKEKKEIFDLYFNNIKYINNWDLVDLSAPKIVGRFIKENYSLKSENCSGVKFLKSLVSDKYIYVKNQKEKLWEKRIGIVSTLYLIMRSEKDEYANSVVFDIVKKNLSEKDILNKHDLLQKACGWMLREYGKRIDENKLKEFLLKNFKDIKDRRVLLRYSIEKFSEKERKEWIDKK